MLEFSCDGGIRKGVEEGTVLLHVVVNMKLLHGVVNVWSGERCVLGDWSVWGCRQEYYCVHWYDITKHIYLYILT